MRLCRDKKSGIPSDVTSLRSAMLDI
jgi:hypothetical protein